MDSTRFDPEMSFNTVRQKVEELDGTQNRDLLARLTWLDGSAKDQTLVFLYDPMAERFGHTIDKRTLGAEVLDSLYNGISVDIHLIPRPKHD